MLEQQTSWVLICDTCGELARYDYADPVAHFDTEADAFEALDIGEVRAQLTNDGDIECPPCARTRECEQAGHAWTTWRPRPIWSGHVRLCRHCDQLDYRPASTQEVTR